MFQSSEEESEEENEINSLGIFDGERNEKGERHGQGKAILPNGDIYDGNYRHGLRDGRGLYVFKKNGSRFDGEWREGKKHGQGIFWYPDGTRYEGDWRHDVKHGFGAYYYMNGDIYEGSWKQNFRHGLGTYFYAENNVKFMGTWICDRMQGPGKLIFPRHCYHGSWELNLPLGRGCFTFENGSMLHGHYIHVKDPNYQEIDEGQKNDDDDDDENASKKSEILYGENFENCEFKPLPLGGGISAIWQAQNVTEFNPDFLPPDPMPLQDEDSLVSESDKCNDEPTMDQNKYLPYEDPQRPQSSEGESFSNNELFTEYLQE
ncbi:radial spoke head 1 homolog [Leptopilina heterotoma]|uniref:radial spoke head 1 homolog n=1 Tax=Leptopilina heterotoma TaxID=63436 RepID=UPI001CA98C0D|nr:radial spoke head 1 homolog [Leptopilina heterotoma]